MARGINKAIIVGTAGKDPEIRHMADGRAVVNLSLATSEQWKDKATGEKKEATEWHRVTFYGKPAEVIAQYVKKGSQLYVEGKLQTRKWQDKEGNDRYTTEIIGRDFQFIGGKPESKQEQTRPAAEPASNNFDDDVPF